MAGSRSDGCRAKLAPICGRPAGSFGRLRLLTFAESFILRIRSVPFRSGCQSGKQGQWRADEGRCAQYKLETGDKRANVESISATNEARMTLLAGGDIRALLGATIIA